MVKKIITKTTLPSGNLFVERAKFTYVFYDGIELSKRHDQKNLLIILNTMHIQCHF